MKKHTNTSKHSSFHFVRVVSCKVPMETTLRTLSTYNTEYVHTNVPQTAHRSIKNKTARDKEYTMAFNFGAAPAAATGSFNFGAASTPAPAPSTGDSKTATTGGFSFGGTSAAPEAGGFSFGNPPAPAAPAPSASGFSFDTKTGDAKSGGGFNFGAPKTDDSKPAGDAKGGGFSFGAPAAPAGDTKPATGGFSFGDASAPKADTKAPAPAGGKQLPVCTYAASLESSILTKTYFFFV